MDFIQQCYNVINTFFIIYLLGYSTFLILSVTVGSISLYEQRKRAHLYNSIRKDFYMPISIIVPAYNESVTIIDTVQSLLDVDYKLLEIIVVDDGSKDDTSQKLIDNYKMERIERPIRRRIPCKKEKEIYISFSKRVPIMLIRKENGGKADSLNMGINAAEYPFFVCMDADSILQSDALTNIARVFLEENNVVACGGLVRIVNDVTLDKGKVIDYRMPKNILLCMQILEYDRTFLASRLFFDKWNANLIISGAFGLFRKETVIAAGGYDSSTMGEDMELVVKMHAFCRSNEIPYCIRYAADAICWSQAPDNLKDLKKQRRRWHIGLYQSISKHRQMLFSLHHGVASFLSFLYFFIYELLSPYIEIFGMISIIVAMIFNFVNVPFMVLFFLIYAVFGAAMSITAFFSRIHAMNIQLRLKDILKVLGLCLFENIGLRSILAFTRLTAFKGYKKKKMEWGEIKRRKIKKKTEGK